MITRPRLGGCLELVVDIIERLKHFFLKLFLSLIRKACWLFLLKGILMSVGRLVGVESRGTCIFRVRLSAVSTFRGSR